MLKSVFWNETSANWIMIWFANWFYEKMHPSLFCTIYPLCDHSGAGACPSCNWAKDRSFVGPLHVWYCQILPSTYKEKNTSNLNRKCVKKKHYTYILVTMQYSNMLLLLMALMQACSVNRNVSNAITIVCVIHWSLIRSWWGYGLSHSMWGIVNKT